MSKYNQSMGDLFDILIEECAEVIVEITKMKRFGPLGNPVWVKEGNDPPIANIHHELGDVIAIVDILIEEGLLDREKINQWRSKKRRRLVELFDDGGKHATRPVD